VLLCWFGFTANYDFTAVYVFMITFDKMSDKDRPRQTGRTDIYTTHSRYL